MQAVAEVAVSLNEIVLDADSVMDLLRATAACDEFLAPDVQMLLGGSWTVDHFITSANETLQELRLANLWEEPNTPEGGGAAHAGAEVCAAGICEPLPALCLPS